jgi:AraC-like DNA-binding protein
LSGIGDGFDVRSLALTFRTGSVQERHHHPWGQLVFATSGVMRVATDSAAWLIPPTAAIWLPAQLPHQIMIKGEVAMRTLYIAPCRGGILSKNPSVLEMVPLLRELILHISSIGMLDPTRPEQDRLAGLLVDLLASARPMDMSLPMPKDKRALALASHLQGMPDDGCDLAVLAAEAGASLRTLQRIFPGETGLTLEAWRQKARLIHSVACLASGASVTAAGFDCGYRSTGSFIAAFKRQFGTTPRRYTLGKDRE